MGFINYMNYHLVKGEDLNHHGTLYAGRTAEWFVEAGFIAASSMTNPENTVCMQIHGMRFARPVKKGEIVKFESQVVFAGRTKLVTYIRVCVKDQNVVEGFITFIHVDLDGKPLPHGIVLIPETEEEKVLQEKAKALFSAPSKEG